jgi:hypothetical protein
LEQNAKIQHFKEHTTKNPYFILWEKTTKILCFVIDMTETNDINIQKRKLAKILKILQLILWGAHYPKIHN